MSRYLNITNGERNTKFPIYHTELWDYFKKQQQAIWTAEELDLSRDTFEGIPEKTVSILKHLLAFFGVSDSIVQDNLADEIISEFSSIEEIKSNYVYQAYIEDVHCVSFDTKILTDKGQLKIGELVGELINVWNGEEFSKIKVVETGVQDLYRVTLSDGSYIDCTDGHKWFIRHGNQNHPENCKLIKKPTNTLSLGDVIYDFNLPVVDLQDEDFLLNPYIHGLFCADGSYTNNAPFIKLYGEKKKLLPYFGDLSVGRKDIYKFYLTDKLNKSKFFTPINYSVKTKIEWLEGLLDGDGCVNHNKKKTATAIQYTSINLDFIKNVKLLLTTLGISANLKIARKEGFSLLPDGKGANRFYETKDLYCLYITTANVKKLVNLGFNPKRLQIKTNELVVERKKLIKVVNIEKLQTEMTYCFNEPIRNAGVFNGILTGQSETYSRLIDQLITNDNEKFEMFNAIKTNPIVSDKVKWAKKWLENGNIVQRVVAFSMVEGMAFSSTFAFLMFFRQKYPQLAGMGQANELILIDELMHMNFAILLYNNYIKEEYKLPKEEIREMILDCYETERLFVESIYKEGDVIGLSKDKMVQYIQYVADNLLYYYQVPLEFNVSQPLDFMANISLVVRQNFFEAKSGAYQKLENMSGEIYNEDF
jgi:ribonucleotide reductase beta subunit family protein with ferritin-like domain/intein-encoded DNA endonuclease-like protein